MKRTYAVFEDIAQLAIVAAVCGGSDNVRYGREGPEKRFAAELGLRPGDKVWIFVQVPGNGNLAAHVEWREGLWTFLASHGIQPADCPPEVWMGGARYFREQRIRSNPLTVDQAIAREVDANPGSVHFAEFPIST